MATRGPMEPRLVASALRAVPMRVKSKREATREAN
jgi:hypothetical protein